MPKLIYGNNLTDSQRRHVLSAFLYRWTKDNRQRAAVYTCAKCDIRTPYENTKTSNGHTHPTVPLISDTQWLAERAFYVKANGEIAVKPAHCEPAYMVEVVSERKP